MVALVPDIYGGKALKEANFNKVDIASFTGDNVYGGYVNESNANENKVSTVSKMVYGGYSELGNVNENIVIIQKGQVNSGDPSKNRVHGGYTLFGNGSKNKVELLDDSQAAFIVAAFTLDGDLTYNTATIRQF